MLRLGLTGYQPLEGCCPDIQVSGDQVTHVTHSGLGPKWQFGLILLAQRQQDKGFRSGAMPVSRQAVLHLLKVSKKGFEMK